MTTIPRLPTSRLLDAGQGTHRQNEPGRSHGTCQAAAQGPRWAWVAAELRRRWLWFLMVPFRLGFAVGSNVISPFSRLTDPSQVTNNHDPDLDLPFTAHHGTCGHLRTRQWLFRAAPHAQQRHSPDGRVQARGFWIRDSRCRRSPLFPPSTHASRPVHFPLRCGSPVCLCNLSSRVPACAQSASCERNLEYQVTCSYQMATPSSPRTPTHAPRHPHAPAPSN